MNKKEKKEYDQLAIKLIKLIEEFNLCEDENEKANLQEQINIDGSNLKKMNGHINVIGTEINSEVIGEMVKEKKQWKLKKTK